MPPVRMLRSYPPSIRAMATGGSLKRQGFDNERGFDRAWRLWNKAGLQVPRKRPRKRIAAARARSAVTSTVIDEYTRESLAIDVAGSIRSKLVIEVSGAVNRCAWRAATSTFG